jgi:flagellar motility protein MotE (MotC chaperone)
MPGRRPASTGGRIMKRLWSIISFLAVVHLLALIGFVGWLWQTGRLSQDRVLTVREIFAPTLEDEIAAAEEKARLAAADQAASDAERRLNTAPVTSSDQIGLISKVRELSIQSEQALEQERAMFNKQLETTAQQLADKEAAFEARKQQWEAGIEAERARRSDAQFAKAVALLEQMGAKPAKDSIVQLMREGNVEQAVAYLNAMSERIAAKILVEMKDPSEAGLATVLLERLRRFGLEAEPDEVTSNADDVDNAT